MPCNEATVYISLVRASFLARPGLVDRRNHLSGAHLPDGSLWRVRAGASDGAQKRTKIETHARTHRHMQAHEHNGEDVPGTLAAGGLLLLAFCSPSRQRLHVQQPLQRKLDTRKSIMVPDTPQMPLHADPSLAR